MRDGRSPESPIFWGQRGPLGNAGIRKIVKTLVPYDSFVNKVAANHGPHTGIGEVGGNMYIPVIKAAMDVIGLRGGEVRLPLVSLNDEEKDELGDILRAMKIAKA